MKLAKERLIIPSGREMCTDRLTDGGSANWYGHLENMLALPCKLEYCTSYRPAILLPEKYIFFRETLALVYKNILFIKAKNWKQLNHPSTKNQ